MTKPALRAAASKNIRRTIGNRRWTVAALLPAALSALLSGCKTAPPSSHTPADLQPFLQYSPYPRGDGAAGAAATAEGNRTSARHFIESESRFYTNADYSWPEGLPQFCVSLSGGGLRAASTAIGVLQGISQLQAQQQLPRTDVLSAVSGGAYALYWLYGEGLSKDIPFSQMLPGNGTSSAQLDHLDKQASTIVPDWFGRQIQYFGVAGLYLMGQISRLLPQWSDEFRLRSGVGSYYSSMLNLAFNPSNYSFFSKDVELTQIREKLAANESDPQRRYPLPVIGSAVRINTRNPCSDTDDAGEQATATPWRYFEATPLRIGSYITGYREPKNEELRSLVTASGAAPDKPASSACSWLRAFGALTGYANPSFRPSEDSTVNAPALKSDDGWIAPPHDTRLVMSDGGFADNLAMFPAVSRICKHIVVVDAAHDPYLQFDDLHELQQNLRRFHGIELQVERVDELVALNGARPRDAQSAAEPDGTTLEYRMRKARAECLKRNPHCKYADQVQNPIFDGKLLPAEAAMQGLPFATTATNGSRKTLYLVPSVTIIKLSLDNTAVGSMPEVVKQRYVSQRIGERVCASHVLPDVGSCYFPQDPTEDQNFEDGQFSAYRELGRSLVLRNKERIRASMAVARASTF